MAFNILINSQDKPLINELLSIFSDTIGEKVSDFNSSDNQADYYLNLNNYSFGIPFEIELFDKLNIQNNKKKQEKLMLVKIILMKVFSKKYNTEVFSDFPKNKSEWGYYMCNKSNEFFEVEEEAFPYEKISDEQIISDDTPESGSISIIPIFETAKQISIEDLEKRIRSYFEKEE